MIRTIHPRDVYACRGRVLIGAIEARADNYDEVGLIVYENGEGTAWVKPVLFGQLPGDEPTDDLERFWAARVHAAWREFVLGLFRNVVGVAYRETLAYQETLEVHELDFGPPYGTYKVVAPTRLLFNREPISNEVM